MTSVFQLYGRPLAENDPLPPLMIVGSLPSYEPGNSYEGRLDVLNAIGKCTAEIVESSLPPGAYVFVDNFTKEVVLAWPTYTPPTIEASGVPNGDFEQGDDGQWRKGAGWSIEAGGAETGTFSGVFANHRGASSIESARVPYNGETITASARFQQGASSSGNLAGRILLIWCDENGNTLPGGDGVSSDGGNIISSGSNGAWGTSTVTAKSEIAKTVAVGFSATRKKQNRIARVDNFVWDHSYRVGTVDSLDYTVTIKVTDSANRVAYWTGSLSYESVWLTSKLYGIVAEERLGVGFAQQDFVFKVGAIDAVLSEAASVGYSLQGFLFTSPLQTYSHISEPVSVGYALSSWSFRNTLVQYSAKEDVGVNYTLTAWKFKQHPLTESSDAASVAYSLTSWTIT